MNINAADEKQQMEKKKKKRAADWILSPTLNLRPMVADVELSRWEAGWDGELLCFVVHLSKLQSVSLSEVPAFCKHLPAQCSLFDRKF